MKSNINSDQVKKLIIEAVEKALEECAFQHQATADNPDSSNDRYRDQPSQLKLTFLFRFNQLSGQGVPGEIWCLPVIDLSQIK